MKHRLILLLTLLTCSFTSFTQTRAVTEYGDTIYVYDNGTWSFERLEEMPEEANELSYLRTTLEIDTLDQKFSVPANTVKSVKNRWDMFSIKYDDNLWKRVPPATLNDEAEFAFQSKISDIWCIIISEETSIAPDKLFLIAKNSMKEFTGAEPKVLKTEMRKVNGGELLRGVMLADVSGITFIFDTYYFSNDAGSVQFTTWTSDNVWERKESEILDLLNGFVPSGS